MTWPLVWRSRLVEAIALAGEARSRATEAELRASEYDAWRNREVAAHQRTRDELRRLIENPPSDAALIRAAVRAQEWEAIAMELISRGAGRPTVPREARPENIVAKKIREEAGGDPALVKHWNKMAAELRAAGKSDEEIVGKIGWETTDPPAA